MSRALPILPPRTGARPRTPHAEIIPPTSGLMTPPAGRSGPMAGTDFTQGANGQPRFSWQNRGDMGSPMLGSYGVTAWNATASTGQRVSRQAPLAAAVSLDMLVNNPHIASIILAKLGHVLGTGLVLSAKVDAVACGITEDEARNVSAEAERLFKAWAENPRECDWAGVWPLAQQASAGFVSYLQSGELLAIVDAGMAPDARTFTKVRLLDPTQLDRTKNLNTAGGSIINGVEFSGPGRVIAYWVREVSPGRPLETVVAKRIPAVTRWGRPKVVHAINPLLPLQVRGLSPLTPALTASNEKELLGEYELTRTLVATSVVNTIYSDEPPGSAAANFNSDPSYGGAWNPTMQPGAVGPTGAPYDVNGARMAFYEANPPQFGPGKSTFLARGDKYEMHTPTGNTQFKELDESFGRRAAKAVGLSAEDVSGDYSKVNMSAARMSGELPYRNTLRDRANILLPFYKAVYRAWLEEQIERGFIRLPRHAKPFLDAVDGYCNGKWLGPGRVQPDLKKYAEATTLLVENGFLTMADALAEGGEDFEATIAQRKREKAAIIVAGLADWTPGPGQTSTQNRKEQITEQGGNTKMSACPPNNPPPDETAIAALVQADPCAILPELRLAYYKAISGTKRSHVSFGGRSTGYERSSPAFLLREIQKLERMCPGPNNPTPHARAATARGAFPGGPGRPVGYGILPAGFLSRYR